MSSLTQLYDDLKKGANPSVVSMTDQQYKALATKEGETLANNCAKHILLDIYCKVLPLDQDYVHGNMGLMKQDVDNLLASKNQNALQYFSSSYEKNNAPLLEFILRSCNNIGKQFVEASNEKLENDKKAGIETPPPSAEVDIVDKDSQMADITGDSENNLNGDLEYEKFIEKIKKKTIERIINEVSDLIIAKNDSKKTQLDIKESAIGVAVDYINEKLWKENVEATVDKKEAVISLAIREATLNILDSVLFTDNTFKEYKSNLRFGKGIVITEKAIEELR